MNVLAYALSRSSSPQHRVNSEQTGLDVVWTMWYRPMVDLFATRFNHQLPTFVSPVPDPLAWATDTLSIPWKGILGVRLPSVSPPSKGITQSTAITSGASHSSQMACPTVVLRPAISDVVSPPIQLTPPTGSPPSISIRHLPPLPFPPSSPRMETGKNRRPLTRQRPSRASSVQSAWEREGINPSTRPSFSLSRRKGAESLYGSRWQKWVSWAWEKKCDPFPLSRTHLVNFMGHLSQSLNCPLAPFGVTEPPFVRPFAKLAAQISQRTLFSEI
ncbi:hypothetical protein ACOMHN_039609 [Nucella lapillus]